MARLFAVLKAEPAAIGTLLSAVLPMLVLAGLVHVDDRAIAGIVVGVNSIVGFAVRLAVVPTRKHARRRPTAESAPAAIA